MKFHCTLENTGSKKLIDCERNIKSVMDQMETTFKINNFSVHVLFKEESCNFEDYVDLDQTRLDLLEKNVIHRLKITVNHTEKSDHLQIVDNMFDKNCHK